MAYDGDVILMGYDGAVMLKFKKKWRPMGP